MFDFMKPIWYTSLTRPNREECRLYPHQLPPFFPNRIIIPLFCTPVPSIVHFCHFSHPLPSLHFAGTAQFRAMFLCSSNYSYWLSLGCYPGLKLTTSSTRSTCSLWLNIFSALKMGGSMFLRKVLSLTSHKIVTFSVTAVRTSNSSIHDWICLEQYFR
jgi:hypothetical protein